MNKTKGGELKSSLPFVNGLYKVLPFKFAPALAKLHVVFSEKPLQEPFLILL